MYFRCCWTWSFSDVKLVFRCNFFKDNVGKQDCSAYKLQPFKVSLCINHMPNQIQTWKLPFSLLKNSLKHRRCFCQPEWQAVGSVSWYEIHIIQWSTDLRHHPGSRILEFPYPRWIGTAVSFMMTLHGIIRCVRCKTRPSFRADRKSVV